MAMRLFVLYAVIELAVIVALTSTIGFGSTVLALLGTFVLSLALAGSQVKRHIRRLQSGLTVSTVQGAATDSVLVENDVPVPICPSRLLVQTSDAPLSVPSSGSVADPVKVTL